MLAIIAVIAILYWIITKFGESVGAIAILVLAGLFIVALCKAGSDQNKAYANRVKYWKNGGPDRRV